eukprot:Gb_19468 [translate_table: standard]
MAVEMLGLLSIILVLTQVAPSVSKDSPVPSGPYRPKRISGADVDLLEFPLNLEFLEAEFFLFASLGYGLDKIAPELASGGPSPQGGQKANLDSRTHDVMLEFAYQEVDHIRAIKATVPGFSRPLLDLSVKSFANVFNAAFNGSLKPPFDPYANSLNCLIASYAIPYVGLTGYVGTNPSVTSPTARRLLAGLLGVESGQDAVIRAFLYEKALEKVEPYPYTVADFTGRISFLRNKLGHTTNVDEGLIVRPRQGAGGVISSNILSADMYSVSYSRTPAQILGIVYSTGNASRPGGFYPQGGKGKIATSFLA